MHSVFIQDKPLHFINASDSKELELAKRGQIISEGDKDIDEVISLIENNVNHEETFYLAENSDSAWKIFISYFTLIEASGGIVQNKKEEFLVIYRLGKWDLPKGKIEYDESPEEAAIREVQEECGVDQLTILKTLPLTFHTYQLKGKRMLKKTHWFLMQSENDSVLVPQKEENILEAVWMTEKEIEKKVLTNTYSSIADLLKNFFNRA